jgi:hypothetical protein
MFLLLLLTPHSALQYECFTVHIYPILAHLQKPHLLELLASIRPTSAMLHVVFLRCSASPDLSLSVSISTDVCPLTDLRPSPIISYSIPQQQP